MAYRFENINWETTNYREMSCRKRRVKNPLAAERKSLFHTEQKSKSEKWCYDLLKYAYKTYDSFCKL